MNGKRIYVCRCSAKKNKDYDEDGKPVLAPPACLYTGKTVQRFMVNCTKADVPWAIFSDLHGVLFPWDSAEWYDKHPDKVTLGELQEFLIPNFETQLRDYEEVLFYYEPTDWHLLWTLLIRMTWLNVKLFVELEHIGRPGILILNPTSTLLPLI